MFNLFRKHEEKIWELEKQVRELQCRAGIKPHTWTMGFNNQEEPIIYCAYCRTEPKEQK